MSNEISKPEERKISQPETLLSDVENSQVEAKRLRLQTAIPTIKAIKNEIISRARDGRLKRELKDRKLGALIRDLAIIKQVLEDNMPSVMVVTPPAPAMDGKDSTFLSAHSVTKVTESDRRRMRKVIEAKEESNG